MKRNLINLTVDIVAAASLLLMVVTGYISGEVRTMKSAEDHLLPSRELALLKTWINAGANWKENK